MADSSIPSWRRWLLPLSWLYRAVMRLRRLAYRRGWLKQTALGVPVVSVGNIRVGGTGKTPIVSAIVAELEAAGRRPAILARGYRSGLSADQSGVFLGGSFTLLAPIHPLSPPKQLGPGQEVAADEARLHSARHPKVPVIIGADRKGAFARFRQQFPDQAVDVVILEDGGQHLAIHRDVDLMLVDWHTTAPLIRSLPSGDYREGTDALKEASGLIITRCPADWPAPPGLPLWQSLGKPILYAGFTLGRPYRLGAEAGGPLPPLHLITGIARPELLKQQLEEAGIELTAASFYGDHERLPIAELSPAPRAGEACSGAGIAGNVGWLITEKDLHRQEQSFRDCRFPVWVVPLCVAFSQPSSEGPVAIGAWVQQRLGAAASD